MSAIPPKADIDGRSPDVRFVPGTDIAAVESQTCTAYKKSLY
jgi:hypothetical protein